MIYICWRMNIVIHSVFDIVLQMNNFCSNAIFVDRCRFSLNELNRYFMRSEVLVKLMKMKKDGFKMYKYRIVKNNAKTDIWEYIKNLPENRTQHEEPVLIIIFIFLITSTFFISIT